ncbi:alpha-2-macroglobulin, partial [bacterium]|nr:alpha-2-macroglobulin [bacterium]
GIRLKDIQEKRTNLNSQEIGDDRERAKEWGSNPVFDEETVGDMVKQGLKQLTAMQLSDGGWGWFSGWAEHSYPHTTAVVVHGLQIAKENGVAIVPGVLEAGVQWLKNYQEKEVSKLKNAASRKEPCKNSADNMDSFIYMVLVDAGIKDKDMCEFLYRDRLSLSVYAKAMYGLALHKQQDEEKLKMILKNIEQYLVQDEENQTAHLNLQNNNYWWCWYGSEYEAHAYYLKLLSRTNPKDEKTSRLVKYLLNNRKHATYWNSTRDTSLCIEALADYLRASGEDKPDLTVEIYLNGQKEKEVKINAENLFTFDNKFVLLGDAVESGEQKIEIKKKGKGALYFNAYLSYFTLEDFIGSAGLEIKVSRKYYKLVSVDKKIKVSGDRGQVVDQKVEKFVREELPNLSTVKSGDLVEIELTIESKNDYEYIIFEDMKPAGFEPVEVRSGYTRNGLGAYMELRDERVCFFIRALARGKHSLSYHIRAEIPGRFSGLPTRASAMYAPELRGNSDEIKLNIED